jgi:hypothetical protein
MSKRGSSWNLVPLPTPSTEKGSEGRAESFEIRLGRGTSYLVTRSYIQNQPRSWLIHIWNILGVGTNHGQPWIHLTHHGPDSGEAITFPHIIFFALLRRTHTRMVLCPGTPKVESQNCPGLDSRNFGRS